MSERTCTRSAYTVEYYDHQNKNWKQLPVSYGAENGVPAALFEEDAAINTMLGVLGYEAAIAIVAIKQTKSFCNTYRQYRLRAWDVSYTMSATPTNTIADFPTQLVFKPE